VLRFVRTGLARDEPVLVAVPEPGLTLVRTGLTAAEAARVRTTDLAVAGRNPGRILGLFAGFVREHAGRPVRMVAEPVWPGRTAEEYPACAEHEALVNVALADQPAHVLCLYDARRLRPRWVADATRTHPTVTADAGRRDSPHYTDPVTLAASFAGELPAAPADADLLVLSPATGPAGARRLAHEVGRRAGMAQHRLADLRLAVQELAVNTLQHAGGTGLLTVWTRPGEVVCQVQDGGRIPDPLAGRRPRAPSAAGHGLAAVHEVCDLVRVQPRRDGTLVRIHVGLT
jgi:anti-sigma regulatory factor (Ser/Thr protein kinase)